MREAVSAPKAFCPWVAVAIPVDSSTAQCTPPADQLMDACRRAELIIG